MKKIMLLSCFAAFAISGNAQIFGKKERKDVTSKKGMLTLHPAKVTVQGIDGSTYYYFLVTDIKCLFVTEDSAIYSSLSSFLPVHIVQGRSAFLEGTVINPFTTFSKKDLDDVSKRLGVQLNGYKVARIFNYGLNDGFMQIPQFSAPQPNGPVNQQAGKPKVIEWPTGKVVTAGGN